MTPAALLLLAGVAFYSQPSSVIAFVDVTVVPMDGERLLPNQTVVVCAGKVAAIGRTAAATVPREATAIQGRGRYLMPALADMHAHLPAPPLSRQVIDNILW